MSHLHSFASTAAIACFALSAAAFGDQVILTSGDVLTGTVSEQTADRVVLQHPVIGEVILPADEIAEVVTDESIAAAEAAEDMAEAIEESETVKEWKSHFELGLAGAFGNTDTQSFHVGVTSKRESEKTRTGLDARYFYGASDGDRTENRFTAGIKHDWLVPDSQWFYFAQGRYDYDEFQNWEHRLSAHGGVGYDLITEEDMTLSLRAGLGVTKEFGSEDEDFRPEALFGADFTWQISERQAFEASSTIYPDLEEMGEFRLVNTAGWSLLLDEETAMSLSAGLQHEYQSDVDGDTKENDFRLFAGLQFDF
jgi:putative salt-induced outer membrane protein YdiY